MTLSEDRPLSGPLYHYTSINVLMSIIESRAIWATNALYMNDASEIAYGIQVIQGRAAERFAKEQDSTKKELLRHLVGWVGNQAGREIPFFVACFSEKRDDLNQWRSYAPGGRGICIGFDHMTMHDCFRERGWDFAHCYYQRSGQNRWADAFISRAIRAVDEAEPNPSKRNDDSFYFNAFESVHFVLLETASRIKHPAFQEEREWRLMYRLPQPDDAGTIQFRAGTSMILPFVSLSILPTTMETLRLAEVIIGPTTNSELALRSLTAFLASMKVEVGRISVSSVPYRQL